MPLTSNPPLAIPQLLQVFYGHLLQPEVHQGQFQLLRHRLHRGRRRLPRAQEVRPSDEATRWEAGGAEEIHGKNPGNLWKTHDFLKNKYIYIYMENLGKIYGKSLESGKSTGFEVQHYII